MGLYCGIDLHSNNHVLTVIDEADRRVYERRLPNDLAITKAALEPYRAELVAVAVESTFNWYWLVDGLMEAGYAVRLVNTAAVRQYEGLKHTNDEHDAFWLAHLMRLGILPTGYIYPKSERGLRDLARQRMRLVQHRSSLITSVQNQVWRSTTVRLRSETIKGRGKQSWPELLDRDLALSVKVGRAAIDTLTVQIERLEKLILKRVDLSPQFRMLKTVTGIGPILAMTIALEVGDIGRFGGVGEFASYCRCVDSQRLSNEMAKSNEGAAGSDGVTFEAIEAQGVEAFLGQIQSELQRRCYVPRRPRRLGISKEGGKVRTLSIPSIRDRVVQGALKLIMEPILEADFQPGSYGYRPRRTAHEALVRVAEAIALGKTHVIDLDLKSYFDGIRHHLVLEKVAKRINDAEVMHLLKLLLKANGKRGVGQGSVLAPLLSNLYLNEVDRMLERAKEYTRFGRYTGIEYARFADDLVVLIHAHPSKRWLLKAVDTRLRQELAKLQVQINEEKSRKVDLVRGESFGFLGFDFRRVLSLNGRWRPQYTPKLKKRTALLRKLREISWRYRSQPVQSVVTLINPILRGWVNYFAVGHSSRCFQLVKRWVELKVRRHLRRARNRRGFGWVEWSAQRLYGAFGLFNGYHVRPALRQALRAHLVS